MTHFIPQEQWDYLKPSVSCTFLQLHFSSLKIKLMIILVRLTSLTVNGKPKSYVLLAQNDFRV